LRRLDEPLFLLRPDRQRRAQAAVHAAEAARDVVGVGDVVRAVLVVDQAVAAVVGEAPLVAGRVGDAAQVPVGAVAEGGPPVAPRSDAPQAGAGVGEGRYAAVGRGDRADAAAAVVGEHAGQPVRVGHAGLAAAGVEGGDGPVLGGVGVAAVAVLDQRAEV